MSGLQPSRFLAFVTQGVALGWDMAAPLALSKCNGKCNSNCNSNSVLYLDAFFAGFPDVFVDLEA